MREMRAGYKDLVIIRIEIIEQDSADVMTIKNVERK